MDKINNILIEHKESFERYYQFLLSENAKYNLTAITERQGVFIKHFEDSLYLLNYVDLSAGMTVYDIGTGGGFPLFPLMIANPDVKGVAVEATGKKCEFLTQLSVLLQLNNVIILNKRAEELAPSFRETADVVMARAVAKLAVLLELLTPLAKVGGKVVILKSDNYESELEEAKGAIKALKLSQPRIEKYNLSQDAGKRTVLIFEKTYPTATVYPRRYTIIKSKPL